MTSADSQPGENITSPLHGLTVDQVKNLMDTMQERAAEQAAEGKSSLEIAGAGAKSFAYDAVVDGGVIGLIAAAWTKLRRNPFSKWNNLGKPALIGGAIGGSIAGMATIAYQLGKREGLLSSVRHDEDGGRHLHIHDERGHQFEHVLRPDPEQEGAYTHAVIHHGLDPNPPKLRHGFAQKLQLPEVLNVIPVKTQASAMIAAEPPSDVALSEATSAAPSKVADIVAKGPQTPRDHAKNTAGEPGLSRG